MRHFSRARLGSVLLSAGLVLSLATAAGADDLTADQGTALGDPVLLDTTTQPTQTVSVTLVAVDDDGHDGCNLVSPNGHELIASVTSNDETVATVSTDSLEFHACGPAAAQSFDIAAVAGGSTSVTIAKLSSTNAGGPNAIFSTEIVYVTVSGDGGQVTVCDGPAAPAWAAHILKSSGKAKKQTDVANYVSQVAKRMDTGASFLPVSGPLVAKSNQSAYAIAVRDYLRAFPGLGDVNLPTGWPPNQCTTSGTA